MKEKEVRKSEKGITLVALVITVVVMLILAGVAIAAVVNGDGLFDRTRQAAEIYENAAKNENQLLKNLIEQIDESLNTLPDLSTEVTVKLVEGMVPVKYNEGDSSWYVATEEEIDNNTWYEYLDTSIAGNENQSKWANVMLRDGLTVEGVTDVKTVELSELYGKKVISEGSMYVWIPRYAYKIASGYHTDQAGEILIKFLNTDNTFKDKSTAETLYIEPTGSINASNAYILHPAFNWEKEDGTPVALEGIWIGKFEASSSDASFIATDAGNVQTSGSVVLRTVGNVNSWKDINRNNIFLNCYNMNSESNASIYGISTNKDEIDPHLIKNTEWGAAAYLAHSAYGRNGTEVTANLTGFITGAGDYRNNVNMSTTGNVYGIYDMSGGSWEHVAAYVDSTQGGTIENIYLTSAEYSKALYDAADKYKNVYITGEGDISVTNYEANSDKYGDGIFEMSYTSNGGTITSNSGWFGDCAYFANSGMPLFYRGGGYTDEAESGIFAFVRNMGQEKFNDSFRTAITTF